MVNNYKNTIDVYNQVAQQYEDKFMYATVYHHSYENLLKHTSTKPQSVLDVACGPGNIAKYLISKRADFSVLGIDAAKNMIDLAKKNVPNATFKTLDCREISSLKRKFDIIIFGFCFPYINKEDVLKLIRDSYDLLNDEGLLYISTMIGNYELDSGMKYSSDGKHAVFMYFHEREYIVNALKEKYQLLENYTKQYQEDSKNDTDLFLIAKK